MIAFKKLLEYSAVKSNVVRDISKKQHTIKPCEVLPLEERVLIKKELSATNYRFWIFISIFFHSGIQHSVKSSTR